MHTAEMVKVVFESALNDDFNSEEVRGVILEESNHFLIVGEIKKKVLIGKNYIIKIEDLSRKRGLPHNFKYGRV